MQYVCHLVQNTPYKKSANGLFLFYDLVITNDVQGNRIL